MKYFVYLMILFYFPPIDGHQVHFDDDNNVCYNLNKIDGTYREFTIISNDLIVSLTSYSLNYFR